MGMYAPPPVYMPPSTGTVPLTGYYPPAEAQPAVYAEPVVEAVPVEIIPEASPVVEIAAITTPAGTRATQARHGSHLVDTATHVRPEGTATLQANLIQS
jgi:hypothetical protein